jgi:hypothetical protein
LKPGEYMAKSNTSTRKTSRRKVGPRKISPRKTSSRNSAEPRYLAPSNVVALRPELVVERQCGAHRITVTATWIPRLELFALCVVANDELFDMVQSDNLNADVNGVIGAAFLELEMTAPLS